MCSDWSKYNDEFETRSGEAYRVVLIRDLVPAGSRTGLHPQLAGLAGLQALHGGRHVAADELHVVARQAIADQLGHLLIEAAQQDRAHHHCHIKAEAGQEAGAFQGDVGGADDQRFTGAVRQREEVVA